MNNVDINFYGERGVINGIILDIKNDIDKTKGFFSSIQLLGTDNLPWRNGVENCAWLIEPSFAQFGNPDFIAVFESSGKKFGLFFEAKLNDIENSCLSIVPGMLKDAYKGNSSKLNVQMSFRYRFVQAFLLRRNSQNPLSSILEERNGYPDGCQRKLNKPIVLEIISDFLKGVDEFYYIALTNDSSDNTSVKKLDSFISPLLQENSVDHFAADKHHFGLLTYAALLDANVISKDTGYFSIASHMMNLTPPGEIRAVVAKQSSARTITGTVFKEWDVRKEWALSLIENPLLRFTELKGSYSAKALGKVVMKLMIDPENINNLMLGLIDNGRISEERIKETVPVKYCINGKEFLFYSFSDKQVYEIENLALLYMDSYFSEDVNIDESTHEEALIF